MDLVACSAEFRFTWLRDRLCELECGSAGRWNPCRFLAAPVFRCDTECVRGVYTSDYGFEKDGLLFYHKEGMYEVGENPLVLLWGDASILRRFYDYGTELMRTALEAEPAKALRWRTDTVRAAITLDDILVDLGRQERGQGASEMGEGIRHGVYEEESMEY